MKSILDSESLLNFYKTMSVKCQWYRNVVHAICVNWEPLFFLIQLYRAYELLKFDAESVLMGKHLMNGDMSSFSREDFLMDSCVTQYSMIFG